jgi:hypothetical protein
MTNWWNASYLKHILTKVEASELDLHDFDVENEETQKIFQRISLKYMLSETNEFKDTTLLVNTDLRCV